MPDFNLKIIGIVLIIGLIIFFTGNYLVDSYRVNQSLHDDLTSLAGVKAVEITAYEEHYNLELTLQEVEDLKGTFNQIERRVKEDFPEQTYSLELTAPDNWPQNLTTEVKLALHQAAQRGEFIELGRRLTDYQEEYNLDGTFIQIQLNTKLFDSGVLSCVAPYIYRPSSFSAKAVLGLHSSEQEWIPWS